MKYLITLATLGFIFSGSPTQAQVVSAATNPPAFQDVIGYYSGFMEFDQSKIRSKISLDLQGLDSTQVAPEGVHWVKGTVTILLEDGTVFGRMNFQTGSYTIKTGELLLLSYKDGSKSFQISGIIKDSKLSGSTWSWKSGGNITAQKIR